MDFLRAKKLVPKCLVSCFLKLLIKMISLPNLASYFLCCVIQGNDFFLEKVLTGIHWDELRFSVEVKSFQSSSTDLPMWLVKNSCW